MKRTSMNFIIDGIVFLGFVVLVATGILIRYLLPPGSGDHATIWGLDRHGWGDLHFWMASGLLGATAFHVILHWRWIVNVVRGRLAGGGGTRVALGIIGILGVLTIVSAPLMSPVQVDRDAPGRQNASLVNGSTTLSELENATGVPSAHIIQSLDLPPDADLNTGLGQLRRRHGFHLSDVRHAISEYRAD